MRYTLKHRLIGAAVLAAVAVLLLPSFFKEKKDYQVSTKSQIPARPNLVAEEFKSPQPVPNIEPAPAPETMFAPTEAAPEQSVASASSATASSVAAVVTSASASSAKSIASHTSSVSAMPLNQQGLPDAWVVQVGSFTTKEAANKLRDDLQADGQKAYVRTTPSGNGTISRVYIGPKLDKNQTLALKEQMDKRLKVKSMVMRFQP
ncbi:SPOR domain-containing protein [Cellvibrio sp.]|uniref:SPOR domain-containing protein n=1 Tax=Cellvibrio sp. TaxID=1965322 RepID=UPI003964879C